MLFFIVILYGNAITQKITLQYRFIYQNNAAAAWILKALVAVHSY